MIKFKFILVLFVMARVSKSTAEQVAQQVVDVSPAKSSNNNIFIDTENNYSSHPTKLITSSPSFRLGLRYDLPSAWSMAVSFQYKKFFLKESNDILLIPNIAQDCTYRLMLYHPIYLYFGARMYYFFPIEKFSIPPHSDKSFKRQFGSGIFISPYFYFNKFFANLKIERFRGIQDNKIHGFSLGAGLGVNL